VAGVFGAQGDAVPDVRAVRRYESMGHQLTGLFQRAAAWTIERYSKGRPELALHCVAGATLALNGIDWSGSRAACPCGASPDDGRTCATSQPRVRSFRSRRRPNEARCSSACSGSIRGSVARRRRSSWGSTMLGWHYALDGEVHPWHGRYFGGDGALGEDCLRGVILKCPPVGFTCWVALMFSPTGKSASHGAYDY
jgi:hypothetical protein